MADLPEEASQAWEDREGPIYEDMKTWNPAKHPRHAAAAVKVEEVYCGAERLL